MDPEDLLLLLLSDEVQRRDGNRLASRAQRAQLAPSMVFDEWDANAKITYDRQLLDQLRLLHFLEKRHHVLIMGPVGVGKTMLAHALGHEAIRRGHGVHCESAESYPAPEGRPAGRNARRGAAPTGRSRLADRR